MKNEALPENCTAQGLHEASQKLSIMHLSGADLEAYEQYEKQLHIQASEVEFSIKRALRAEAALEEERRQKDLLKEKLMASGMTEDEI